VELLRLYPRLQVLLAPLDETFLHREKDEDKVAPRAWWRFTSRPTMGFLFGTVLTVGTFIEAGGFLAHTTPVPVGVVAVLVSAFLAIAYFHSAYRLTKLQSLGRTTQP
jgi:hypothetical protein